VALRHAVNANQVFQWRRLHRDGKLGASPASAMKLLPISVVEDQKALNAEPEATFAKGSSTTSLAAVPSTG
jgi:transposase-like protein